MTQASFVNSYRDSIREAAYFIWLEEGCPEGQHLNHWEKACHNFAWEILSQEYYSEEGIEPCQK